MPFGTQPSTMTSARILEGDREVSPPLSVTLDSRANFRRPRKNRSTHDCGNFGGTASERKAALGRPPIAAMSLSPRTKQRWPTDSGECHSRRKWTFSSVKSVVTKMSLVCRRRSTAQSSPIPVTTFRSSDLEANLSRDADFALSATAFASLAISNRSGRGKPT